VIVVDREEKEEGLFSEETRSATLDDIGVVGAGM